MRVSILDSYVNLSKIKYSYLLQYNIFLHPKTRESSPPQPHKIILFFYPSCNQNFTLARISYRATIKIRTGAQNRPKNHPKHRHNTKILPASSKKVFKQIVTIFYEFNLVFG
jgi:hypothetical protein